MSTNKLNKDELLINVKTLMGKLGFPVQAQEKLMGDLDKISNETNQLAIILSKYDETEKCDYNEMLAQICNLGKACGVHEYSASLLLFLCMGEKLRERYAEREIDEKICYDSMADLAYKLEECRLVKHEVGSFVASWFAGFFDLTRFALGRLQFEMVTLDSDCVVDGVELHKENKAINMHIPRTGTRLEHEKVLDAYRQAAEFFKDEFKDGAPIIFVCSSWLLYPWNEMVLAPDSNLLAFYKDFTIVASGESTEYGDAWRLFDCEYTGDPDVLPKDTSFRRAYAERMKKCEPLGWGKGVFLYENL